MFRWTDTFIPLGVLACLLVIFVPMPAGVLDYLLAANITLAVVILLTSIYVKTPLELNLFPALLLGTTFARLALNISTTRLILTRGAIDKENAAGSVIQNFGEFVAGNDIAVGLIIFAIIIIVQFVVITKGATRISEVAARFSLDGLPGKQLAIDADLNANLIDSETAQQRREELNAQADFYGAMDGASKFVRGDAIAGIFITLLNIAGGLILGFSRGMSLSDSASIFTMLTIGDGLVSQLPALLISIAAALLITRASRPTDLPRQSLEQLFSNPIVLGLSGFFLITLAFTNLPKLPLLGLATLCIGGAWTGRKQHSKPKAPPIEPPPQQDIPIEKLVGSDVLEMELGRGLIQLADPGQGGVLLQAITSVRKQLAKELGIILPKVRVRDNLDFPPYQYRVAIQGNPVDSGEVEPECCLAVDTGSARGPIDRNVVKGIFNDSLHPEPAYWIPGDYALNAQSLGYFVLTSTDVLADQLKQCCFQFADELLTRDATRELLNEAERKTPEVVNELIPEKMSVGQLQKVLQNLVAEHVSVRPIGLILECLSDHADKTSQTWELTELVRQRLSRQILTHLQDQTGLLFAFTLDQELQESIQLASKPTDESVIITLSPVTIEQITNAIRDASMKQVANGRPPVLLVNQNIRRTVSSLTTANAIDVTVLGTREIGNFDVQIVGDIGVAQLDSQNNQVA